MNKLFKKASLVLVTLSFIFTMAASWFTPNANAQIFEQGPWYWQGLGQWYLKVHEGVNHTDIYGERYTQAQVNWIINALITWIPTALFGPQGTICLLSLVDSTIDINACANAAQQNAPGASMMLTPTVTEDSSGGALMVLQKVFLDDRPLSGFAVARQSLGKLTITPSAYAQEGFGYASSLSPVQNIWEASRNVTYTLIIFVVVLSALAIMFRVKVSGQAAYSLQSALPKLVIALILITFSYAIAGLMVDFMYVLIGLIAIALGDNPVQTFNYLTVGPAIFGINLGIVGILLSYAIVFPFAFLMVLLGGFVSALGGVAGAIIVIVFAYFFGFSLAIAFFFMIVFIFLKTYASLLMAVVKIFLLTIFSPFAALLGALPSSPYSFGKWASDFMKTLVVFPVVGIMIMLSNVFLQSAINSAFTQLNIGPLPIIGDPRDNSFIPGAPEAVALLSDPTTGEIPGFSPGWPPLLNMSDDSGSFSAVGVNLITLFISLAILFKISGATKTVQDLLSGKGLQFDLNSAKSEVSSFGNQAKSAPGTAMRNRGLRPIRRGGGSSNPVGPGSP